MSDALAAAAAIVYESMTPTVQRRWPLLERRCGTTVWVKHEQHAPTGAFKVRGGLVYFHERIRGQERIAGAIAATRGNHGQSVAFAARQHGVPCAVVVPHGNSVDKNRAMQALGAELIEEGHDFQSSLEAAAALAKQRGWHMVPSFDELLVRGVATCSLELFRAVPDLDTLYVPIGLGSGICGAIAARDALNLRTKIVGVVSAEAPACARSLEQGRIVSCEARTRIADGVACRTPDADALHRIRRGAERVVEVSDDEVEEAMRVIYGDTHTVAEGAAATGVAAMLRERERLQGQHVAVVLTGSNVDRAQFARVLSEGQGRRVP